MRSRYVTSKRHSSCKVVSVYDGDDHLRINLFFEVIVAIVRKETFTEQYVKRFRRCLVSYDLAT